MEFVVFYSSKDPAGERMASALTGQGDFTKQDGVDSPLGRLANWKSEELNTRVVELKGELVTAEWLDSFSADLFVFASRHESQSTHACFTVHSAGNWNSDNRLGGNQHQLALTSATAIKSAHAFLKENDMKGWNVLLEATHHGPTSLKTPSIFLEVGSRDSDWRDEKACAHAAQAIIAVIDNHASRKESAAVGFGGGHYNTKFNALEDEEYAFSFLAPKYALDSLNKDVFDQVFDKTIEKVSDVLVDWTGTTAEQREMLTALCQKRGMEVERI